MSGTIYVSESNGDWGTAAIWSTDAAPDAATADVTVGTDVTIASGESFTAGTLDVAAAGVLALAGSLDVTAGASVNGGIVLDGGLLGAGAGLTLATTASALGGSGTVDGTIDNAGLIYAMNGLLDLAGPVSGSGALEIDWANGGDATLELGQGGAEAVGFLGTSSPTSADEGVLKLDEPGAYSGTISGYTLGDAIDLSGTAPGSLSESFSGNGALGTLIISNASSVVASLTLAGDFTARGFTLMSDGDGGTDIELTAPLLVRSTADGDWGNASIWSSDSVPDDGTVEVTIDTSVSISAGETFTAGSVAVTSGTLGVTGDLQVGGLFSDQAQVSLTNGTIGASSIDLATAGDILQSGGGPGAIDSSGTLLNDGGIASYGTLALRPAIYQQGTAGELYAGSDGTIVLAPTDGAAGFTNLVQGTLSGGSYVAEGGTLVLPAQVTEIENAFVQLIAGTPPTVTEIETGGAPLESSLSVVGSGAELNVADYDYVTAGTLTVEGGTIALESGVYVAGGNATLSPAELILAAGSSELEGSGTVTSAIQNSGTILASDGTLDLAGTVGSSGSLEIGPGFSTLELGQSSAEAVYFEGVNSLGAEVLQLDDPISYAGTISGFTGGQFFGSGIDLPEFAPGTLGDVYNGTTAGGVLDILAPGSIVASLTLSGDYTHDSFTLVSDGSGGTFIELVVPCFTRGTRISTQAGEIAVEDLRVGDRVLTATGEVRPIVWIGQRRVDCARHPRPELVRPVRVRAGAFGAAPRRDLLLSPDHSVYAEGVLIPVKYLINGVTVVQESVEEAHYFHVELDRHDVLLAEGLPAESYLDTGNRAQFAAGPAAIALHADFAARSWGDACAPLVTDGPAVLAVRRRLLARIAGLGWARRTEPQFAVLADGEAIPPETISGKLYRWVLPAGTREARLVSSTAVPAGLDLAATDCRTLGARIGAVFVDEDFLPLGNPALAAGFHPIEGFGAVRWRWTDGSAVLALPPGDRPRVLELLVRDVMAGWQEARAEPAMAA